MAWVLVVLVFVEGRLGVMPNGVFISKEDCLSAQEHFMKTGPQPQINYDTICVNTDQLGLL